MIDEYKWLLITGFLFWCIAVFLGLLVLIAYDVYNHAISESDVLIVSLPFLFIAIYVSLKRTVRLSPMGDLVITLSLLALFFAINLYKAMINGFLTSDYLTHRVLFVIYLSIFITLVFVITSQVRVRSWKKRY